MIFALKKYICDLECNKTKPYDKEQNNNNLRCPAVTNSTIAVCVKRHNSQQHFIIKKHDNTKPQRKCKQ